MKPFFSIDTYIYISQASVNRVSAARIIPYHACFAYSSNSHISWNIFFAAALLPILFSFGYGQGVVTGSTVVAIRTPDEIIVGADSKLVVVGDESAVRSTCKIHQIGNMFFACTGLIGDTDGSFNVITTVGEAYKDGNSILSTIEDFERLIAPRFAKSLSEIRQKQPDYYQRYIQNRSHFNIIFFGIEKRILVMYWRQIKAIVSFDNSIQVIIDSRKCPGDCPTGMTYMFLGEQSAINKFLDENPHYSKIGWVPTILKLIGLEIEEKPNLVGSPIDIIYVNKNGAKWIRHKKECPDITTKQATPKGQKGRRSPKRT